MNIKSHSWKQQAKKLKKEVFSLYFAYKDPRVPWYAKLIIIIVVGYALSPIDLIPDFIPILGYLDDLILIPFGVALAIKLIPPEVLDEGRIKAEKMDMKPKNWVAAAIIVSIWIILFVGIVLMVI